MDLPHQTPDWSSNLISTTFHLFSSSFTDWPSDHFSKHAKDISASGPHACSPLCLEQIQGVKSLTAPYEVALPIILCPFTPYIFLYIFFFHIYYKEEVEQSHNWLRKVMSSFMFWLKYLKVGLSVIIYITWYINITISSQFLSSEIFMLESTSASILFTFELSDITWHTTDVQ